MATIFRTLRGTEIEERKLGDSENKLSGDSPNALIMHLSWLTPHPNWKNKNQTEKGKKERAGGGGGGE